MLTKTQIEKAMENRNHLVIQSFDMFGENYWNDLVNKASSIQQKRSSEHYYQGFIRFYNEIHGKEFSLTPEDIISIWSRATEIFPLQQHAKYALSTSIAIAYSTNQTNPNKYSKLYESHANGNIDLPIHILNKSQKEKQIIEGRFSEIEETLSQIKSNEQLKENEDSLLATIRENWTNGIMGFGMILRI